MSKFMDSPIFKIPMGEQELRIYPAFILALLAILLVFAGVMACIMIMKNKKQEKRAYRYYEITDWQRKHLIPIMRKRNQIKNEWEKDIQWVQDYMDNNCYWNLDEILEGTGRKSLIILTICLLEASIQEYSQNHKNNAVLILHAIDFMNGGMDGNVYGSDYEWIGSDIDTLRTHSDMTDEEARTMYLFASALADLLELCDKDLEKIPEDLNVEPFCKTISLTDMELAADELGNVVDIHNEGITDDTRDVIARGLYNNLSILLGELYDHDDIRNVDEYRRYTLRALVACIDRQPYSEFIETVE